MNQSKWTDPNFEDLELKERKISQKRIYDMLIILRLTKKDIEKEIRNFYQEYGKDGVITYREAQKFIGRSKSNREKRMVVLFLVISNLFDDALQKINLKFDLMFNDVIDAECSFFEANIEQEERDKIIKQKWGSDNDNWSNRTKRHTELWTALVITDLKQSFLRKDHVSDVIIQLNDRFKAMEKVLGRLGITESTAIGTMARRGIFKLFGVTRYRFYTRKDERTCEHCNGLHGLVFPISAYEVGVTASPIHPRCRCWEVPIINKVN